MHYFLSITVEKDPRVMYSWDKWAKRALNSPSYVHSQFSEIVIQNSEP